MSTVLRMTYEGCAQELRVMIGHRERMHQQGFYEMTPDGGKFVGKVNPDNDLAYQTMLVALECVERSLTTNISCEREANQTCRVGEA